MTPQEAHQILELATQPAAAGKMSRQDFYRCEVALAVFAEVLQKLAAAELPTAQELKEA